MSSRDRVVKNFHNANDITATSGEFKKLQNWISSDLC